MNESAAPDLAARRGDENSAFKAQDLPREAEVFSARSFCGRKILQALRV
jgi:hypothetical protein